MKYADIHCHTIYSNYQPNHSFESSTKIETLLSVAQRKGLSAIAITDHNTMDGYKHAIQIANKYKLAIIPAQEVDTNQKGQILAYGIKKPIVPFQNPRETINQVRRQGGLAIIAHPFDAFRGMENLHAFLPYASGIEITNYGATGNKKRIKLNDNQIKTGGSDAHTYWLIGTVRLGFPDWCNKPNDYLKCLRKNDFIIITTKPYIFAIFLGFINFLRVKITGLFA